MGRARPSSLVHAWKMHFTVVVLFGLLLSACSAEEEDAPALAKRVIDLVRLKDLDELVAAALMQERPCSVSVEASPPCEDGDADGTLYQVFPSAVCQGFWTRDLKGNIQGVLRLAGEPFAVARLGAAPTWAQKPGPPYGDYVIVFAAESGSQAPNAVAIYVTEAAIVRTQVGCQRADQFLEPGVDEEKPQVIWRPD